MFLTCIAFLFRAQYMDSAGGVLLGSDTIIAMLKTLRGVEDVKHAVITVNAE